MTITDERAEFEAELQTLARTAAPSATAPADLAAVVLRRARVRRRRRSLLIGAVASLGILGSVAAFAVGRGPYFDVVQPSAAMEPTIVVGQSVTFDRDLSPRRGDVVYATIGDPQHQFEVISRVIGRPGDTVSCPADDGPRCQAVLVNGHPLNAYLNGLATRPFAPVTVPAGRVFVMGDNRDQANDSRFVGTAAISAIEGVAVATTDSTEHQHAIPGAPPHRVAGDQDVIDPPLPVPAASATSAG